MTTKAIGYLKAPTDGDVGRLAQAIRDCAKQKGLYLTGIYVDKPSRSGNGAATAAHCLRVRGIDVLVTPTPEAAKKIERGLVFELVDASGLIGATEPKAPLSEAPPPDETPAKGVDDDG